MMCFMRCRTCEWLECPPSREPCESCDDGDNYEEMGEEEEDDE